MAKGGNVQDALMDAGQMKVILKTAGNAPVEQGGVRLPIVVALDNEEEAVVLVAKKGKGRKLRGDALKAIKSEGVADKIDAQAGKLYFGYAFTSTASPGALMISVNKKPQGESKLVKALYKRVRPAGFSDVILSVNETIENESDEETAEDPGTPPPPAPPPPPSHDAADLRKRLATLAGRIAAGGDGDPAARAKLLALANEANEAIKADNLGDAATKLDALAAELDRKPAGEPGEPPAGETFSFVKMQKSRLVWEASRKKVASEIEQFKKVVSSQFAGDPDEDAIVEALDDLDDILIALDDRLIDALDDLLDSDLEAPQRDRLLARARSLLDEYASFASSDPLLKKLDGETPFGMKLSAASTFGTALKALRQTIG